MLDRILTYYRLSAAMPCIVLEHPMQNVDAATLQQRAEQIVSEVLRLLAGVG